MSKGVTLCMVLVCAGLAASFPNGAPELACNNMMPRHGKYPQNWFPLPTFTKEPPFEIVPMKNTYTHDRDEVHIQLRALLGGYYKGVFIQARKVKCREPTDLVTTPLPGFSTQMPHPITYQLYDDPVGEFKIWDDRMNTVKCWNRQRSAVTHMTRSWKINETVTWTSRNGLMGPIIFRGTFVREQEIYWIEVNSTVVHDSNSWDIPTCSAPTIIISAMAYLTVAMAAYGLIYIKDR